MIWEEIQERNKRDNTGLIIGHKYWEFNACYGFGAVPGPCMELGCQRPLSEHAERESGGMPS